MTYQYSLTKWQRVSVQAHVLGKKKENKTPKTTKPPSNELHRNSRAGADRKA